MLLPELRVLVVTKGRPEKSGCKVAKNQRERTEIYLSFQIRSVGLFFTLLVTRIIITTTLILLQTLLQLSFREL